MEAVRNDGTPGPEMRLPAFLTMPALLRSGEEATMRPLRPDEPARFGDYLLGLSPETRARYGPHPFDRVTAESICATLDPTDILRMVATIPHDGDQRIIAYTLLKLGVLEGDAQRYTQLGIPLNPDTDSTVAPSVADDYQNQGVGSLMMRHVIACTRRLGRQRIVLWYGVQATNDRAVHCYTKWGFRKVGEFTTDRNNFDMILELRTVDTVDDGSESSKGLRGVV
jgi:GNAT superfamily N-acetyltransferase